MGLYAILDKNKRRALDKKTRGEGRYGAMANGQTGNLWLIVLALAAAVAAAALILMHKKRKKTAAGPKSGPNVRGGPPTPRPDSESGGGAGTIGLWDETSTCRVTLTDIHFPDRSYEKTITTSLTIGFAQESDICVDYDRTVSRRHCEIIRDSSGLYLVNHSQSNGTLLNGYQITARAPLLSGSILKMGRVEMRINFSY